MIKEFLWLFPHATIRLTTNAYNKVSIYRARTEEFLWTIPHALNGRSKFGRTLRKAPQAPYSVAYAA